MDERITAECPVANEFTRENLRDFCAWYLGWNGKKKGMIPSASRYFNADDNTIYRRFDDVRAGGLAGRQWLLDARISY